MMIIDQYATDLDDKTRIQIVLEGELLIREGKFPDESITLQHAKIYSDKYQVCHIHTKYAIIAACHKVFSMRYLQQQGIETEYEKIDLSSVCGETVETV